MATSEGRNGTRIRRACDAGVCRVFHHESGVTVVSGCVWDVRSARRNLGHPAVCCGKTEPRMFWDVGISPGTVVLCWLAKESHGSRHECVCRSIGYASHPWLGPVEFSDNAAHECQM